MLGAAPPTGENKIARSERKKLNGYSSVRPPLASELVKFACNFCLCDRTSEQMGKAMGLAHCERLNSSVARVL